MPIKPTPEQTPPDVDSLTRQLLERLRSRNAALQSELQTNQETIGLLEKRLNLQPTQGAFASFTGSVQVKRVTPEGQEENITKFKSNVFFGLTQKEAVIKLLRLTGEPMKINTMVESLTGSGFSFKSKSPYRVLWKMMSETPEIQKQGSLFGLREWKEQGNASNGKLEVLSEASEDPEADSE
jgi:hypothetical protein